MLYLKLNNEFIIKINRLVPPPFSWVLNLIKVQINLQF